MRPGLIPRRVQVRGRPREAHAKAPTNTPASNKVGNNKVGNKAGNNVSNKASNKTRNKTRNKTSNNAIVAVEIVCLIWFDMVVSVDVGIMMRTRGRPKTPSNKAVVVVVVVGIVCVIGFIHGGRRRENYGTSLSCSHSQVSRRGDGSGTGFMDWCWAIH